ncbi:trypsin alpha-3 isoform X2 [Nilaparvata lugens]|uniref:trypsin alpha-3 isoform X2 n=1 Tax=Nilaparvata lugens TaxID=108931 RepID=UPI00193D7C42|nr:trypsin alpha-3 isoform X2 [Nilaparvata lugens]
MNNSIIIISEGFSDSEEHDIHEDEIIENEEKIQGGKLSNIIKHPYMISIQREGETEGAAFIINRRWALTAAYHFWGFTNGSLTFRAGSSLASRGRKVHVESFFTHPGYLGRWKDDLTVFKLTKPLPLSRTIRPIGLASSLPKNGSLATTCGWGYQKWGFKADDKNDTLRTTTVKYTESKSCLDFYPGELNEGNFCSLTEGKSPCVFDWGAPLVFKGKAFGLFVGGHGCGSLQSPPVYIDLTKYKKWINYIIKKH